MPFLHEEQHGHTALETTNTEGLPLLFPLLPFQLTLPFPLLSTQQFIPGLPMTQNRSLVIYGPLHSYTNKGLCKTAANEIQWLVIQYESTAGLEHASNHRIVLETFY